MSEDSTRQAAEWLASDITPPHPIIPYLRARFCLTAKEACEAARRAEDLRKRKRAHDG